MNRFIYTLLLLVATSICTTAQEHTDTVAVNPQPTIADHINTSNIATVNQPDKLNLRLIKTVTEENAVRDTQAQLISGYRIQAFSGNNARTAKRDADNRAKAISNKFPEYSTYVTFDAPYWRLRIGDFTEYEDAAAVLTNIKKEFPSFARELRLVRDKIKVVE